MLSYYSEKRNVVKNTCLTELPNSLFPSTFRNSLRYSYKRAPLIVAFIFPVLLLIAIHLLVSPFNI